MMPSTWSFAMSHERFDNASKGSPASYEASGLMGYSGEDTNGDGKMEVEHHFILYTWTQDKDQDSTVDGSGTFMDVR